MCTSTHALGIEIKQGSQEKSPKPNKPTLARSQSKGGDLGKIKSKTPASVSGTRVCLCLGREGQSAACRAVAQAELYISACCSASFRSCSY